MLGVFAIGGERPVDERGAVGDDVRVSEVDVAAEHPRALVAKAAVDARDRPHGESALLESVAQRLVDGRRAAAAGEGDREAESSCAAPHAVDRTTFVASLASKSR